jgi:hypothetical protein
MRFNTSLSLDYSSSYTAHVMPRRHSGVTNRHDTRLAPAANASGRKHLLKPLRTRV